MSQEVIYRKYRPQFFKDVVGQKPINLTLQNEIISGQIAHAYLFVGPRGTGKTTLARLFTRALNCLNRKENKYEPCNECQVCQGILQNRSTDVIEIDAASNTGVDNVRDNIITNAQLPPMNRQGYKVFIIDEVHMLSKSAFNALLKTLEEPPRQVIFILATTEVHKVPETIISRCQRFDFKKITQVEIAKRLQEICEWENIRISDSILAQLARKADGSLRDAQSLLGQIISLGVNDINEEAVELFLPRNNWNDVDSLVEALRLQNLSAALNIISKLISDGVDIKDFSKDFVEYLRQIILYQVIGNEFALDFSEVVVNNIKKQAQAFPLADLNRLINIVLAKLQINESLLEQLPLELACIEFILTNTPDNIHIVMDQEKNAPSKPLLEDLSVSVYDKWSQLVDDFKKVNRSAGVLLHGGHVLGTKDRKLTIGLQYSFHVEKLDTPSIKNQLLEILAAYNSDIKELIFLVDNNFEQNHRQFKGAGEKEVDEALGTFGGDLV